MSNTPLTTKKTLGDEASGQMKPVQLTTRVSWNPGVKFDAIPWDGIMSMADGRAWYACPICEGGITGPLALNGPVMVHQECIDAEMQCLGG